MTVIEMRASASPAPIIGIVACCAQKLDRRAPARDLYTSPLFRMSLAYALPRCSAVYVASALHGLVELDEDLAPYDFKMTERGKKDRIAWGERFVGKLTDRHGLAFDVLMLAGTDYAWPIARALHTRFGFGADGWRGVEGDIVEPMAGMQIGQRLAFLKRKLAHGPNDPRRGDAVV